ncbi:MAG: adenylosuccinate lyase [Firmicutes bacterium]|nr:adenylosuccinate lyase [Bacillota bacterium]
MPKKEFYDDSRDIYENPLVTRYARAEMAGLFSERSRVILFRKLWIALAEAQADLGVDITEAQIAQMRQYAEAIDFAKADEFERELRHDVMAHIRAFAAQAPLAAPVIHLGATSCYVTDNADLIILNSALRLVKSKLLAVLKQLRDFAVKYKSLPMLGLTHLQPAQLTTAGKRAALWMQDIVTDVENIDHILKHYKLRGAKGTTGTQAGFLSLFNGDSNKVKTLDRLVVQKMGFAASFAVTGQTYPRKFDYTVLSALSGVAQSAAKFAGDMRILQSLKEMEEPFESTQVGSSAMAYKRNPMRSERVSSLARFLINLAVNGADTASTQWFERTLDDSANRRIVMAQAFLAADGILNLYLNITENMVVYDKIIERRIAAELPFMATENILMEAVKAGGDRQLLHERIRIHAMESARRVKSEGLDNDLIERLRGDPAFGTVNFGVVLKPENYTGRAAAQVDEYVSGVVDKLLKKNKGRNIKSEVNI